MTKLVSSRGVSHIRAIESSETRVWEIMLGHVVMDIGCSCSSNCVSRIEHDIFFFVHVFNSSACVRIRMWLCILPPNSSLDIPYLHSM